MKLNFIFLKFAAGTAGVWAKQTTFNTLLFLPYHVVYPSKLTLNGKDSFQCLYLDNLSDLYYVPSNYK